MGACVGRRHAFRELVESTISCFDVCRCDGEAHRSEQLLVCYPAVAKLVEQTLRQHHHTKVRDEGHQMAVVCDVGPGVWVLVHVAGLPGVSLGVLSVAQALSLGDVAKACIEVVLDDVVLEVIAPVLNSRPCMRPPPLVCDVRFGRDQNCCPVVDCLAIEDICHTANDVLRLGVQRRGNPVLLGNGAYPRLMLIINIIISLASLMLRYSLHYHHTLTLTLMITITLVVVACVCLLLCCAVVCACVCVCVCVCVV